MRQRETQLATVLECCQIGLLSIDIDIDNQKFRGNEVVRQLLDLGMTYDMSGVPLAVHKEKLSTYAQGLIKTALKKVKQEGLTQTLEYSFTAATGATRWLRWIVEPSGLALAEGRIVGVVTDITSFKESEEGLALSERRQTELISLLASELRSPAVTLSLLLGDAERDSAMTSHDLLVRQAAMRLLSVLESLKISLDPSQLVEICGGETNLVIRLESNGQVGSETWADDNSTLLNSEESNQLIPRTTLKRWSSRLGGVLSAETSKGSGAAIDLQLASESSRQPVKTNTDERKHAARLEAIRTSLSGCHVLLVDADAVQRSLLDRQLANDFPMEFSTVGSGKEALERLKQQPVELLITDNIMPGMTGEDLIKALRRDGQTLPIIAISVAVFGDDGRKLRAAGADLVLEKPLQRGNFGEALVELV